MGQAASDSTHLERFSSVIQRRLTWSTENRASLTRAAGTGFGFEPPGPKNIRRSFDLTPFAAFAEGAIGKRGCHAVTVRECVTASLNFKLLVRMPAAVTTTDMILYPVGPEAATRFLKFVNASPTPFHAVQNASIRLENAGFHKVAASF
jgi:hypothetical protein